MIRRDRIRSFVTFATLISSIPLLIIVNPELISKISIITGMSTLEKNTIPYEYSILFTILIFMSMLFILIQEIFPRLQRSITEESVDTTQRAISAEVEQSERRIEQQLLRALDRKIAEVASSDEIVSRLLDQKLQDGIIEAADRALSARAAPEAKRIRLQRFLDDVSDRLRIKYDGPAGRAENSATIARRLSYAFATLGLMIACVRVFLSGGFTDVLVALLKENKTDHFWPLVFAQSAPWIGLVLLVEFTALIFFRFYLRAIELQRYFTRELANSESRFGALRVITEIGSDKQVVQAALLMMEIGENLLQAETDADLPENVSALADVAEKIKSIIPGKS
jgi:hypothetical protein